MADDLDALLASMESRLDDVQTNVAYSKEICMGCKKDIHGQFWRVLNNPYHPECFKCSKCSCDLFVEDFMGENASRGVETVKQTGFIRQNSSTRRSCISSSGIPWCEVCYRVEFSNKCEHCYQPIAAGVKASKSMGKQYHPECFKCAKCGTGLANQRHYVRDAKNVCANCS